MSTQAAPSAALTADVFERFPAVRGHLDTATAGVPPLAAVEAMRAAVEQWAQGRIDGPGYDAAVERSRAAFAEVVLVEPAWVAQGGHVSAFVGLVASSLPGGRARWSPRAISPA